MSRRSKLTAPDLERLARTPCPLASLASSGISPFNSALARSCSRKAERVDRNRPATSAQELDSLMSTILTASIRGCGGFDAGRSRRFAGFNAAPELSLGGDQEMLIERIGGNGDLDPFAA